MTFCVPTMFVWVASNGLYSLEFDVLERCAVEDRVDLLGRADQAVAVADVTDEEAHVAPRTQPLALVELLGLVPSEDPDDGRVGLQQLLDQAGADGP